MANMALTAGRYECTCGTASAEVQGARFVMIERRFGVASKMLPWLGWVRIDGIHLFLCKAYPFLNNDDGCAFGSLFVFQHNNKEIIIPQERQLCLHCSFWVVILSAILGLSQGHLGEPYNCHLGPI